MGGENTVGRELTFGEKAVGLTFNPSGDEGVSKVKRLYADAIDLVSELSSVGDSDSAMRTILIRSAIENAVIAQMMAVKALTWKD